VDRVFHNAGAVFGGFLAALADQMLGLVSMTVLEDSEMISTSDLRVLLFPPP
jgi:acyl-coenzyme A thioesterase PaaI-like protein